MERGLERKPDRSTAWRREPQCSDRQSARLKLSGRGKTTTAAPRSKSQYCCGHSTSCCNPDEWRHQPPQATTHFIRTATVTQTVGATALQMEYVADAVTERVVRPASDVVVPISRKLTLLQLSERTCKWPIGDPLNEDFHFCGSESG